MSNQKSHITDILEADNSVPFKQKHMASIIQFHQLYVAKLSHIHNQWWGYISMCYPGCADGRSHPPYSQVWTFKLKATASTDRAKQPLSSRLQNLGISSPPQTPYYSIYLWHVSTKHTPQHLKFSIKMVAVSMFFVLQLYWSIIHNPLGPIEEPEIYISSLDILEPPSGQDIHPTEWSSHAQHRAELWTPPLACIIYTMKMQMTCK